MPHVARLMRSHHSLILLASGIWSVIPTVVPGQALNGCDLNRDGAVNILDVQLATNMVLGLVPCGANIAGAGVCNPAVVQEIENAALTGNCALHSAALTWTASTSANVVGYNLYRATQAGGPYTKLTSSPVAGTSYVDITVQAGQTYYYVATAVDSNHNESGYSNQATATVPAT